MKQFTKKGLGPKANAKGLTNPKPRKQSAANPPAANPPAANPPAANPPAANPPAATPAPTPGQQLKKVWADHNRTIVLLAGLIAVVMFLHWMGWKLPSFGKGANTPVPASSTNQQVEVGGLKTSLVPITPPSPSPASNGQMQAEAPLTIKPRSGETVTVTTTNGSGGNAISGLAITGTNIWVNVVGRDQVNNGVGMISQTKSQKQWPEGAIPDNEEVLKSPLTNGFVDVTVPSGKYNKYYMPVEKWEDIYPEFFNVPVSQISQEVNGSAVDIRDRKRYLGELKSTGFFNAGIEDLIVRFHFKGRRN